MELKKLTSDFVRNKVVLYRAPYDIGIKDVKGQFVLKDTSRLEVTLPTLNFLLENNCKIVIVTWVKRPNGREENLSTLPHANALSTLLHRNVRHIDDCVGTKVAQEIDNLKPQEVLMLENTRFHHREYDDNDVFAEELTTGCDVIVFDAFPQAHRKHASTTGILRHLPAVCGFYFEKEYLELSKLKEKPEFPFTIVLGGAKISDKIGALNELLNMCDYALIGGAVSLAFLKAKGYELGASLIESTLEQTKESSTEIANTLLNKYPNKIILPTDLVLGDDIKNPKLEGYVDLEFTKSIDPTMCALDIGEKSTKKFIDVIKSSTTIFWNGPMGLFENERFAKGSLDIANAISEIKGNTVVCGGDTIEVVNKLNIQNKFSYISVAGTAAMDFLGGKEFPIMRFLQKS